MDIFSEASLTPGEMEGTYDVRLSLSLTGAVAVIVLDFYRLRPFLRFTTGMLGIPLVLGGTWALFNLGFDWWDVALYGILLTGAAVFSSSRFHVYMAEEDPTEAIEGTADESAPVGGPVGRALALLELARQESEDGLAQSQQVELSRFQWGLLTLVLGITMCGTGLLILLTGGAEVTWRSPFFASVGLGLSMLSGVLLYASGKARKAATFFSGQIDRLRELEIALSLGERQPSEDGRALTTGRIIDLLLKSREADGPVDAWLPAIVPEVASDER